MTDPHSDPLFDALRDQLADYGQEPPAHLWAGIRQQLPPPVALPQRRRRRTLSVALLALLAAVIGVVSWQAWELSPLRQPGVAGPAASPPAAPTLPPAAPGVALPPAATRGAGPGAAVATVPMATAPANALPGPAPTAAVGPTPAAPATTSTTTATPDLAAAPAPAARVGHAASLTLAETARPGHLVAGGAARAAVRPPAHSAAPAVAATAAVSTTALPSARTAPATKASKAKTTAATATRTGEPARLGAAHPHAAHHLATTAAAATSPARPHPAVARHTRAASQPPAASGTTTADNQPQPAFAGATPPARSQPALAALSEPAAGRALPLAYDQLAPRQPALAELPAPTPADPSLLTVRRSATPRPPAARWALQTLAGPVLSGVREGAATKAPGNVPATIVNNLTETEQHSTGGSLQFGLRRNFDAHWSLSAGLGLSIYSTQSTISQHYTYYPVGGNAGSSLDRQDTLLLVSRYRKTYEMFSLPVRLGYAWQPSARWQLGLLAGADAVMLSRVNKVWALPTQANVRTSSHDDYHQFSFGTSLGLEARYHFSPRCQLVAQPTFTYQLTPLKKDRDGVAPRHLWGAALLLGVAYDFH